MSNVPSYFERIVSEIIQTTNDLIQSSGDVDHDQTSNRTHEGDDLSPDNLDADSSLSGPTASEGDVVTVPDNPDVVPIYFDAETGEPLVPDLEETV